MKNYKTTILGLLTILGAIIHAALDYLNNNEFNLPALLTTITVGIGLIKAADAQNSKISRWP